MIKTRRARKIINYSKKKYKADEVVQKVFIKIWESRENLNPELSFKAYIFQAAKNLMYNDVKKELQEIQLNKNYFARLEKARNYTEDLVIYNELEEETTTSIDSLPLKQKEIFLLSCFDGYTNDEIATKLNISKRTVENQIYRATQQVRSLFKVSEKIIILLMLCSL